MLVLGIFHPNFPILKQEVLERTDSLLSFDTTWTAQKTVSQTILRCRGNVFTEPLPSNDRRDTQTHRLMGGIYELCLSDGHKCHDIHTKFHNDWFSHSKVEWGGDSQTHEQTVW
jgi:hypothetical protein